MKILEAVCWRADFRLHEPYTIAYETYDRATNYFVRLRAEGGEIGLGCAAPAPEVTGESVAACGMALAHAVESLRGADAGLPALLWADLAPALAKTPAAAAAVDTALRDLLARRVGLPLYEMLGACRRSVPTSITLGIDTPEETLRRAREHVAGGFRALKVKGGRDAAEDIERILALRRELGPDVALRFDANQGFAPEAAERFALATAAVDVELLEQPLTAGDARARAELHRALEALRATGVSVPPVMADEDLVDVADAVTLVAEGCVQAFNVKLMKLGGIGAAGLAAGIGACRGVATMVSCMDESALGIAAALHWALACPDVAWVDLDGHLDLVDDPATGAVRLDAGHLSSAPGAGLAVDLDPGS